MARSRPAKVRFLAVKRCTSGHFDDPPVAGDEGAAHRLARLGPRAPPRGSAATAHGTASSASGAWLQLVVEHPPDRAAGLVDAAPAGRCAATSPASLTDTSLPLQRICGPRKKRAPSGWSRIAATPCAHRRRPRRRTRAPRRRRARRDRSPGVGDGPFEHAMDGPADARACAPASRSPRQPCAIDAARASGGSDRDDDRPLAAPPHGDDGRRRASKSSSACSLRRHGRHASGRRAATTIGPVGAGTARWR